VAAFAGSAEDAVAAAGLPELAATAFSVGASFCSSATGEDGVPLARGRVGCAAAACLLLASFAEFKAAFSGAAGSPSLSFDRAFAIRCKSACDNPDPPHPRNATVVRANAIQTVPVSDRSLSMTVTIFRMPILPRITFS
jgi:hypothetical protein